MKNGIHYPGDLPPFTKDQIDWLKENLKIEIRQLNSFENSSFSPDKKINVRLIIGNTLIDEDSCIAPQTYHGK